MNAIWRRISAEPALITGSIVATINVVAAFRAWTPTPDQLAAINSALAAVFALLIRATVMPTRRTPVRRRRTRPRQRPAPAQRAGVSTGEPG